MTHWIRWLLLAISVWLLILTAHPAHSEDLLDRTACTYNGIKLYGKVQIVEHYPDITVQPVTSFPDLKVKVVESFPDACGQWQFVTAFPDVKVKFVTSFPDVKIRFVETFPGID